MTDRASGGGSVADLLDSSWSKFSGAPALWAGTQWFSFEELGGLVSRAVRVLRENGIRRGDRVVLVLPNSMSLRVFELAAIQAGAVRVALSPRLHDREVAAIIADCSAGIVVCPPGRSAGLIADRGEGGRAAVLEVSDDAGGLTIAALAERLPGETQVGICPDEPAMIMYSSGTTGRPKGAIVTHGAWCAQLERTRDALPPMSVGDVALLAAPMTHFAGSMGIDALLSGVASVLRPRFDADDVWRCIDEFAVTILPLAPVHLDLLVSSGSARSGTGVRAVPYGGSAIALATVVAATRLFPGALTQFYGLAEALAPISTISPATHDLAVRDLLSPDAAVRAEAERALGSAGTVVADEEVRVVDGELLVKGGTVSPGYWRRPELNESRFIDGWFRTGDAVDLTSDGVLTVRARTDDVIVTGGFNVYPAEVENVILTIPGITEAVVLGAPDARWGEAVVAAVVAPGVSEGDLEDLADLIVHACVAQLAGYKKPTFVRFIDVVPRNAAGKVLRTEIRRRMSAGEEEL